MQATWTNNWNPYSETRISPSPRVVTVTAKSLSRRPQNVLARSQSPDFWPVHFSPGQHGDVNATRATKATAKPRRIPRIYCRFVAEFNTGFTASSARQGIHGQLSCMEREKGMSGASTVLVVEDEETMRAMLRRVLENEGFTVTAVGTVPEALALISQSRFDVLISDLNIGHPADGFVVVGAMRRTYPDALTFILTGYPGFETALEAVRQHINDYLVKGTPVQELVEKIKTGLVRDQPGRHLHKTKRVPDVIEENKDVVIAHWLQQVMANDDLRRVELSDADRIDHVPGLLDEAITHARNGFVSLQRQKAADQHGTLRYRQRYTVPMLILEARLLQDVVSECIRQNFLVIDLSKLVADITKMSDTLSMELEQSVRAFTKQLGWRSPRS
jgi:ActR/RegA family two-component response regulator